jgi:hypothetical protein
MKRTAIIIFLLIVCKISMAQAVRPDPVVDLTTAGFREFKPKPDDAVETVYINDKWLYGTIVIAPNSEVKDIPIKYDVKNNFLEIQTKDGIKIASKDKLKSFSTKDALEEHHYVNADALKIKRLTGIAEVLVSGKLQLYAGIHLRKIPANYNPAMDVGSKIDTFVVDENLFLIRDNEAFDITKAGKKILKYFGDKSAVIESYVKQNKLSYKEKSDIIKIVEEFNKN